MKYGQQYKATSIEEYLSNIEPTHRAHLQLIITLTKRLVPKAEETISYGMPTFKYKNQPLIHFAAFKNHISLIPAANPIKKLKDKLQEYKHTDVSIQFPVDRPLPETLIEELIRLRVQDIEQGIETHKV